ncbi:phage integrase family protein [Variovorax guangxiensis]|uniref:phage integrase family protein n=1 Tax=Variovorax guangxiensis TaxID=1775474 RepID=UPI00285C7E82|nr:phage integrase family protein [Variovorax guangxiensis]MDR6860983.1 integrase [Variovorax guangxiensis]
MKKPPPRKLHRGHFAFMRALAQGLDERASWDRYLRLEGEHTDLRTVRRTIAWIRDQFAAAARREQKPGTARLILLDPDRFTAAAPALPTLAEFAAAQGLEDFSEAEQIEAYEAAYPAGGGAGQGGSKSGGSARPSRRARVIDHQLEALRWLEGLVVQDPRPSDSVAAWLHPTLAARLERAGLPTLVALVERINGIGARWWAQVPGVGERKAARILDWLHANEAVLGLRVGVHVVMPRAQLTPTALASVVPAATALVPYEKFQLPAELDGREGHYRAPQAQCRVLAVNDHEAIGAWLAVQRPGEGNRELSSTQRSYRKEAERLLLWSILERKKALSSLSGEDASAYCGFIADPPSSWCGPRHHQRWSPMWRPLEGPLTPAALRQSLVILRSLFAFLVSQGYVVGNPFAAVALPPNPQGPLGANRTLSFAQWDHLDALLQEHVDTEAGRRLRRGMRWLYATGLRLAEITSVQCDDLEQVEHEAADGTTATGWLLSVRGKGGRIRQVPVPGQLVEELGDELARHGFERQVGAISNQGIPVMARFDTPLERPVGWSASGLYQAIKAFLGQAATRVDGMDARQLRRASTHWLRHTHGSHALRGREGQTPVPIRVVQNNLGHASLETTSMYLTPERDEGTKAMREDWHKRPT